MVWPGVVGCPAHDSSKSGLWVGRFKPGLRFFTGPAGAGRRAGACGPLPRGPANGRDGGRVSPTLRRGLVRHRRENKGRRAARSPARGCLRVGAAEYGPRYRR